MDLPPHLFAILGEAHICVFSAPELHAAHGHLRASIRGKQNMFISPHPPAFSFSPTECPLALKREFPLELVICVG